MCKLNIMCIYRSPDGQLDKLQNKLELVIQKQVNKNKNFYLVATGIYISFERIVTKRT